MKQRHFFGMQRGNKDQRHMIEMAKDLEINPWANKPLSRVLRGKKRKEIAQMFLSKDKTERHRIIRNLMDTYDAFAVKELFLSGALDGQLFGPAQMPAVSYALLVNSYTVSRELINAGCDPNERCANGYTPLYYATRYGYPAIVLLLIEAGADLDAKNGPKEETLFQILTGKDGSTYPYREKVLDILVSHGADTEDLPKEPFINEGLGKTSKRALLIAGLFLATFGNKLNDAPSKEELAKDPLVLSMAKEPSAPKNKVIKHFSQLYKKYNNTNFKNAKEFSISQEGINMIKKHEGLRLSAYALGDKIGKEIAITIGYGHAKPKSKSEYKVGQRITKEEAEKLLREDLKRKEAGVKRIFAQWEQQGIDIPITQGMYDAMVSMAFNMGINGLRQTQFIQELKKGNYEEAAELIPKTRVGTKFKRGLTNRREDEKKMFLTGL